MSTLIILILVFLLLSAFFSGSEIAFISANKLGIEVERNRGSRRGRILAGFFDHPKRFLGTMLVGNNIALVVFTLLMTELLKPALESLITGEGVFILVSTLIITLVVLVFGEFLPKILARYYANSMMTVFAFPLYFFKILLLVPSWVMTKTSNLVLRVFLGTPVDTANDVITRLDLQDFVEGTISIDEDHIERDMFKNALHLKDVRVTECMVPRTEIAHIDVADDMEELVRLFEDRGFSRIIVVEGDIDQVIGYIHHQQLLTGPSIIRKVMRGIDFVPETMSAKDLMSQMILDGTNITCVVDEFGGTAGIITLEDILEEIFGEIEDEHDEEEFLDVQLTSSEYRFSGRVEVDYVNEKYPDLNIPEGDYNTLSGYIVMTSGEIPEQGQELIMGTHKFVFESVTEKRIEIVRLIDLTRVPSS